MRLPFFINVFLWVFSATADDLLPKGVPFILPPAIEITWIARTNDLPQKVWVYKVIPQRFSQDTISNLLHTGDFSTKDKSHIEGQSPFKDKSILYFADKDKTRYLGIFPPIGWIDYSDEKARSEMKELVEGVPTEEEALQMAFDFLPRLGISRSDLVTETNKIHRVLRERGRFDKTSGTLVKEVISRGVFFTRKIDGVEFTGIGLHGGMWIDFGNHGRIAALQASWRKLQPVESHEIAQPDRIVTLIKQGKARISPQEPVNLTEGTRLAVTKMTPYYLGKLGEEPQETVFPFCALEIQAISGETNFLFRLNCPIFR